MNREHKEAIKALDSATEQQLQDFWLWLTRKEPIKPCADCGGSDDMICICPDEELEATK